MIFHMVSGAPKVVYRDEHVYQNTLRSAYRYDKTGKLLVTNPQVLCDKY